MCRRAVLLADRAGLVRVSSWSHLSQLCVGFAASSVVSSAAQELWAAAHTAGWSGAGWLLVTAPVESQHSHRKGEHYDLHMHQECEEVRFQWNTATMGAGIGQSLALPAEGWLLCRENCRRDGLTQYKEEKLLLCRPGRWDSYSE